MRGITVVAVMLLGFVACGGGPVPERVTLDAGEARDVDSIVRAAIAAHETGDYRRAVELDLEAEALLPDHPRLLFNTACSLALVGDRDAALARLERVAELEYAVDLDASPSLDPLRDEPRFHELRRRMAELLRPLERSSVVIVVPDRTFLVEGVAVDPTTGDLLLSSLYQRRIARVTADGDLVPFTETGDDRWSMLGMAVDDAAGDLWTVTVANPRMAGAEPDEPVRSALVRFSLATGAELGRFPAPDGIVGSSLDTPVVAADGTVYVSDSGAGAIHRLAPGSAALEPLTPPGSMFSPQGLALSADGGTLYAADYGRGVAAVDPATGEIRPLDHDGPTLLGIDGLARHHDDLIAIQNGVRPPRVVRIVLTGDGLGIERVELLERAHHLYREPTLGTVVGDDLIYVAASQWRSFDEHNSLLEDELVEPAILRLPVGPRRSTGK